MAKISAWLAIAAAAAIMLAMAPYMRAFDFGAMGPLMAAALLGLAAWRTLTGRGGGMRLLCGAGASRPGSPGTRRLTTFRTSYLRCSR